MQEQFIPPKEKERLEQLEKGAAGIGVDVVGCVFLKQSSHGN